MNKCFVGAVLTLGTVLASNPLLAQAPAAKQAEEDKEIAAMRKELRAQRKAYILSDLKLTDKEAAALKPVLEPFLAELAKIGDQRIASLKQLANQDSMTSEQSVKWVEQITKQDQALVALRLKYIPLVAKVLPGKKTAQFFSLERRTQMMIDLDLPLKN